MTEYAYKRFHGSADTKDLSPIVEEWINNLAKEGFEIFRINDGFKSKDNSGFCLVTMVRYA